MTYSIRYLLFWDTILVHVVWPCTWHFRMLLVFYAGKLRATLFFLFSFLFFHWINHISPLIWFAGGEFSTTSSICAIITTTSASFCIFNRGCLAEIVFYLTAPQFWTTARLFYNHIQSDIHKDRQIVMFVNTDFYNIKCYIITVHNSSTDHHDFQLLCRDSANRLSEVSRI